MFAPHSNSAGGRINVNSKPIPFDFKRTAPLTAALKGLRKSRNSSETLRQDEAEKLAENIYLHQLAESSPAGPGKNFPPLTSTSSTLVYESPGEVAEIKGVADRGEESEQLLSDLSNVITARGNVFSVYTIGQALKQTPAGKLVVTAEQRQQAMVERYTVSKNTVNGDDDEVRFRTVYLRNLSP